MIPVEIIPNIWVCTEIHADFIKEEEMVHVITMGIPLKSKYIHVLYLTEEEMRKGTTIEALIQIIHEEWDDFQKIMIIGNLQYIKVVMTRFLVTYGQVQQHQAVKILQSKINLDEKNT